jgi:transcriptional regulator with XRE-family HTH domain
LSLQSVDTLSDHEFRAATVASYERGERLISVVRLARLASIYNVPADQLLPDENRPNAVSHIQALGPPDGERAEFAPMSIDLARLRSLDGPDADLLRRAIGGIVRQRSDTSGQFVTIRCADVVAIGRILNRTEMAMRLRLAELSPLTTPT